MTAGREHPDSSPDLLRQREERYRLLVESVRDYAIFMLDPTGIVRSWNQGAARIKGYAAEEIIGRHFSTFYPAEALAADHPRRELEIATAEGRFEEEGWRVRKDGTQFWASVVISAVRDETGTLIGFAKVTRDLTERRRAEQALVSANRELAATTYTIAHDLRSPLRAMDGYSRMLQLDHADRLDAEGMAHLARIRANAQRMGELIDGVLSLARLGKGELQREQVDVSAIASSIVDDLRSIEPDREVEVRIAPGIAVTGDRRLLSLVVQNLVGNAWKFTRERRPALIEVADEGEDEQGMRTFVVRDNGVGFDAAFADRLFGAFQRLHHAEEFEGHGIGLATVRRIVERHGGRARAEGRPGAGAAIRVTLPVRHVAGRKTGDVVPTIGATVATSRE